MAAGKAINVKLGAQRAILDRQLETGHYESASEVLRDALRALDERDAVYDAWLQAKVKASMANKRPSISAETVFARLEAKHARRVKAAKRGA